MDTGGIHPITSVRQPAQVSYSTLLAAPSMPPATLRFRDSWPIRIGVGIIASVIALIMVAAVGLVAFGYNPPVEPAGIWAFLWLILGACFVVVGIGQTIVRR